MAAFNWESEAFGYSIMREYLDMYVVKEEKLSTKKFISAVNKSPKAPGAFTDIIHNI